MLDKLSNTFFGSLLEQLEDNDGRIRINYRLGVTATGRLSSGKEERE
jgi:DNA polymerase I-like protein with 3'-5' exonuclease and polymerase domains